MKKKLKSKYIPEILITGFVIALLILSGCRGQISQEPPIHLNPNMDAQAKFKAYGENDFYADGRSMRPLPEGTVPRGHLNEDKGYYDGVVNGKYVANPLPMSSELMQRGRERYDIYCSMCHGKTGLGGGMVIQRGFILPPSYADERILNLKDGELYSVIKDGVRNMPGYALQIPTEDRWAIVAYIRALQRAQTASIDDVPDDKKGELD